MKSWLEKVKDFRQNGSFEGAMAILKKELEARPEDPEVHYQIAWTHDALGLESDAAPAYERAIALGLSGKDLEGAFVGLGSTYRSLGEFENSKRIFEQGIEKFPNNRAMRVFYSILMFNLKDYPRAMEILLKELVETTGDESILEYRRALLFYSDKLDQKFS